MMSQKLANVSPDDLLMEVIELMRNEGVAIVSVTENDQLVGVLDRNNIESYLRLKAE